MIFRRPVIYILIIVATASLILMFLQQTSQLPNRFPNGFRRDIVSTKLILTQQAHMTEPLQEICGIAANHVYFTVPNPQWLIMLDNKFKKQDTLFFGLYNTKNLTGAFNTVVDSPFVYFFANSIPALYRGQINASKTDTFGLPGNIFTRSVIISKSSIILRALTKNNQKQVFQKINIQNGKLITQIDLIKDQTIGGFESDGLLKYDSITKRLFYIEYYRNRLYCLDSNLNLLHTGHTIDTVNANNISTKWINIGTEKRLMPANPRSNVNMNATIANGYLFIQSGLKADNEESDSFRNNSVIDVYQQSDFKYRGSFYLPYIKNEKVKSFLIKGNLLIALYKNYTATYQLPLDYYSI